MNENALQHWGIKGMKWGVRRYQNKDGTLTALGRKREREMNDKLKSANKELKALRAENDSLKKQTTAQSRRTSEMSDDEIRQRINRLQLEKQYAEIYNQVHPNTDKPHPGKVFAKKILSEAVVPSLVNVGKSAIEKSLKKALGLEDKPDVNKQLDLATKKAELALKQIDYESKRFELDKKKNPKSNSNAEQKNDKQAKKAEKEAKKAEKQAKKETEKDNKDQTTDNTKTGKQAKNNKTSYEDPEVIFNPNAKKKGGGYRGMKWEKQSKSDTIIDAEWWDADTPTSNLRNNEVVWSGRSFVSGLLDEPR